MWLIVGLGNPGNKYARTRHNIGFSVVDRLSGEYNIPLQEKDAYVIGKGAIEGNQIVLLKPLAFMNRSGLAVKKILKKSTIQPNELIVIHDDLDLEPGMLKIRKNGSSGGHRGVESIIQEIGTKDFIRVKVGIGRDNDMPVEQYVLSNFRPAEKNIVKDAIIRTVQAVAAITTEGVERAMNRFNRPSQKKDLQA